MAVSVPKRLFKKAADRNLLKRRIREAYRRNKPELYKALLKKRTALILVIQYQQKEIAGFQVIEAALLRGFSKMLEKQEREDPVNG